jgi:DNA (cytosine-5)-methyltransferase 1
VNVLSLFSGAGGMDLGLHNAGMTHVGFCELDPTARSVLARHWPDVPCWEDVTDVDQCGCLGSGSMEGDRRLCVPRVSPRHAGISGSEPHVRSPNDVDLDDRAGTPAQCPECGGVRGTVDLVAGGSPCQDLSVAGRRGGLDGERSGLFWHQCRIADSVAAPWVLWENVAGAFSSNGGADFAAVLWGLTGTLPDVPDGGWKSCGVVVGPKRWCVWRLLDARWFGVAQRRRRVFVVAGPRGLCRPEVLLESEGLPGNPAPSREAGTVIAALTANGIGTCGADDNQGQAGHLIPEVANQLLARDAKGTPTRIDAGEGNLVPVAVSKNQRGELRLTPYARQLSTGGGKPGQGYPAVMSFGWANSASQGDEVEVDATAPIRTREQPAVAYPLAMRGRDDGAELELGEPDVANSLRTPGGGSSVQSCLTPDLAVRRLTPTECEALMAWPRNWTALRADGTPIADSARYRMCGNGVVASVAEWIAHRIIKAAS